jgi:hypothetical protein
MTSSALTPLLPAATLRKPSLTCPADRALADPAPASFSGVQPSPVRLPVAVLGDGVALTAAAGRAGLAV